MLAAEADEGGGRRVAAAADVLAAAVAFAGVFCGGDPVVSASQKIFAGFAVPFTHGSLQKDIITFCIQQPLNDRAASC